MITVLVAGEVIIREEKVSFLFFNSFNEFEKTLLLLTLSNCASLIMMFSIHTLHRYRSIAFFLSPSFKNSLKDQFWRTIEVGFSSMFNFIKMND